MDANANLEKALVINRQLQLQLYAVREKIEKLLKNVKEIYQENEELVRTGISKGKKKGFGMRGAYMKGGTFYLKGSMFFKDYDCRNCPDNPDYHARKQQGEMFPRDLDLKSRHVWSYKDKKGLVEAIKEQIIDHLKQRGCKVDYNTKDINSEQLVKLLEKVSSDFRIDWEDISMHNLQHRHSMNSCEAMWNVFLHPSLKRSAWTQEENLKLADVAKKYNFQNWQAIANEIGRRSEFQCFVQYQNYIFYMENEKSFKWNKEEDERLIEVIEKNSINGQINWSNVMVHFPHRARTTLQSRYTYSLNPRISRARFTPEEDLLLLAAVKEYGGKFSYIPRSLFPNRTSLQLRSRYLNTLVHRHKQQPWTLESDTKLMDFVAKHGTHSWKKCEEFIQTHSRTSCRTRFMVIKRFFEKNPNASLADLQRKKKKRWTYVNTENWTEKLEELRENPDALVAKRIIEKRKPSKPKIKKEPKPRVKKEPKEKVKRKPARKPAVKKPPPVPKPKKRPRKIYIQRLRKNYRILYHSVKYAYDYKLGVHPILNNTPKYDRLSFVRHALQLKNREDGKKFRYDVNIPQELRRRILVNSKSNKDIEIPNGFSLPTSWSTAMAFRALCIHTTRPDLESVTAPSFDASNEHINLFRERFRTLFYTTGLLSRINPQIVLAPNPPPENVTEENSTLNANESVDSQTNGAEHGEDLNRNEGGEDEPPLKRIKITKKLTLVDQILCIKGKEPLGT